jgi:hypothetical protein
MAIDYTIHKNERYVHVIGTARQTMPEMIAVVDAIAENPEFDSSYPVIFNLRNGDYTAELRDGDDFIAAIRRRLPDFQDKFALVVPPHLQVLAKLYSVLAAAGGFDRMQCFLDLEEAMDWCGISA